VERRLAVIFAADAVGFSRLMELDEERTLRAFQACQTTIESVVARHGGRIFGGAGDATMAEFGSPVEAVRVAVEIQKTLSENLFERLSDLPSGYRMQFRIGINLGDVIADGDSLYGDAVNIAARLESLADPGGICISGNIYELVERRLPLTYHDIGEQTVKNIAKPVRVYRVSIQQSDEHLLSITSVETFATNWLAPRLASFQIAHPDMTVRLETMSRLVDLIRDGFDVGIRSGLGDWPGLRAHRLLPIEFAPMASPDLLASAGRFTQPADLLRLPLLDVGDGWLQEWLGMFGITDLNPARHTSLQFVTQLMLSRAVMAGQGIAMLMPALFAPEVAANRMVLPFDTLCTTKFSYWLVYPEEHVNARKIRAFVEWISQEI